MQNDFDLFSLQVEQVLLLVGAYQGIVRLVYGVKQYLMTVANMMNST